MPNLELLSPKRITAMTRVINDPRLLPQRMPFLERTPVVTATDDELFGQWVDRVQIADIINDDAEALTYSAGRMKFNSYRIPKLKYGTSLSESQIKELRKVMRRGDAAGSNYEGIERRIIRNQVLGMRQRMEAIIIGSYVGSYNYDRLGMKIDVTFPIPSDLNLVMANPWTDHTLGDPVNDLLSLKLEASQRYGLELNRATTSLAVIREAVQCVKFQNMARMYLAPNVSFVNLSTNDIPYMSRLLEIVTGISWEINDARYFSQHADGRRTSHRFFPINKVVLTSTAFDNNPDVVDFATGEVIEPIALGIVRAGSGDPLDDEPTYGPYSYATGAEDANPPTIDYWTVMKGFVRRKIEESSAVIEVGAIGDAIPLYDTYPAP